MKTKGILKKSGELRRTLASVKILVKLGREHGFSSAECLANSGITESDLETPSATTCMAQEMTVIRNLQTLVGHDAGLGLTAGFRYNVTTFGILGYAIMSSSSMREGLTIMFRYLDLMNTHLHLRLEEDEHKFCIVIDDEDAPEDIRQFLVERMVAALSMMGRTLVGAWKIKGNDGKRGGIEFKFDRPSYADKFKSLGPEYIVFSAKRNIIFGDKAMLDIPLPHRDAIAQYLSLTQCDQQFKAWREPNSISTYINQHLAQNICNVPDIESMASLLAMTPRTLRRNLADEGTTYRELVNKIRLQKATEKLRSGQSVSVVADQMGFSEASSFIRAYKRWTGRTPGDID